MSQTTSADIGPMEPAEPPRSRADLQADAPVQELRAEIAHLREQLLRAEAQAAEVPGLRARLAALQGPPVPALSPEQRLQRSERVVAQMKTSLSWRVTKPLRALKRGLRG
jgi:hypothetical protein